ncbi:MAG: sel1 repeat family protein, partial [Deltaproteobacteria bacterium]|nr:sel1 repeat family protein [Deltaproteobacteria bacterium]
RGALERRMQRGTVAVQIENGEVRILHDCAVNGNYQYRGFTRKLETHVLTTDNELNANFAMGAARLGATLKQHGRLYVSLSLVGQWENDQQDDDDIFQRPGCTGATHVIESASVGAFRFYSGEGQGTGAGAALGSMAAAGGSRIKTAQFSKSDGDFDGCDSATSVDRISPEGCSALVRLQLRQIGRSLAQPAIAVYDLGEQPFLFSDVVQMNEGPLDVVYRWQQGPYPESLCEQLPKPSVTPIFTALAEYCRIHRENRAEVILENGAVEVRADWRRYDLPPQNPFEQAFSTYDRIRKSIVRLPQPQQEACQHLLLQIIAEYHWHVSQEDTLQPKLAALSEILSPLQEQVSLPLRTTASWWAAHLLLVAGLADYSNSLTRFTPMQFATPWHALLATQLSTHEINRVYPEVLESLLPCDPLRVDMLYKYAGALLAVGDMEGSLKYEIEAERAAQANGQWHFPGANVLQQAQFLGLEAETEQYLNDYPWVLGDFLWSRATNCFIHEDYLCVRQSLYEILEKATNSPVRPMAYRAIVELEFAMGNRKAAFQLKMDEPRWTVQSEWGQSLIQVPQCGVAKSEIEKVIQTVTSGQSQKVNLTRENYELVGRNVGQWQTLLSIGRVLRECRFLCDNVASGWMTIARSDNTRNKVQIATSANLTPMSECVDAGLNQAFAQKPFHFNVKIVVPLSPAWHIDAATGWSRITKLQLACDAGEIEGCYQLGLFLKADVTNVKRNTQRAKHYFKRSCDAGYPLACEQLSPYPDE